jgi:hypothetical protein
VARKRKLDSARTCSQPNWAGSRASRASGVSDADTPERTELRGSFRREACATINVIMLGPSRMRSAPHVPALAVALCVTFLSSASAGTASTSRSLCSSSVQKGALPVWARGGFHPPTQRIPHVLGRSGAIVAILFSYPLRASPPAPHPANKILWVSRISVNSFTNLRISAQRMSGTRSLGKPVSRIVKGGPGPSFFDLPAGCWRLSLRWAGRSDNLDLRYRSKG